MVMKSQDTKLRSGYKQTEIGMIPEDWEAKTFGEVMTGFTSGVTPSRKKPDFYKGDIRWITSGELNYNVIMDTIEKVSAEAVSKTNLKLLPKGTFLIAITGMEAEGTRGSCGIVGAEATTNQHCMALFPTKQLSTDYLFHYYIFRGKSLALQYCQGTKQQDYTGKIVKLLPILLPPLPEQQAIATTLSDVNALIASLNKLIAKKRDIKQATMQQLLTGKIRLPGFSGELKPGYKKTEIGMIPEDWEVKKLGDVAKIYRGASPRPIENPKWFDENSSIGWVRISDVTKSVKYLFNTAQNLSEQGVKQSRFVKQENLIMSICATVGKPVITKIDVCIHDGFVIFEKPRVSIEYLYYYLSFIEDDWSKNGQTGSQMNLNTTIIGNANISLPTNVEEQATIVAVLSDMDAEIATLEQKRDKIRALKQGMMQELLTGKTRLL